MLSGKSYKPNRFRGASILVSLVTCTIALKQINWQASLPTAFFSLTSTAMQVTHSLNIQPTAPLSIHWKPLPSKSLNPSPTAPFSPLIAKATISPSIQYLLNMDIQASIMGHTATITIFLTDATNQPLTGASGQLVAGQQTYQLPATVKNGTTSIQLPQVYSGETISVTETYEGMMIANTLQVS